MKIIAILLFVVWLTLAWLVFFYKAPVQNDRMVRHIEEVAKESALGTWETYAWTGEHLVLRHPSEMIVGDATSDASVVGVMPGGGTILIHALSNKDAYSTASQDTTFTPLHILHQNALVRFDDSAPYEDVVFFTHGEKAYEARISYTEQGSDTWSVLYRVLTTIQFEN